MTAVERRIPLDEQTTRRFNALLDEVAGGWTQCDTCFDYGRIRGAVFIPAAHQIAIDSGVDRIRLIGALMRGAHRRHLAGLPILPEVAA